MRNKNLTGTGTSVRSPNRWLCFRIGTGDREEGRRSRGVEGEKGEEGEKLTTIKVIVLFGRLMINSIETVQ